jgi:hypothetical protein
VTVGPNDSNAKRNDPSISKIIPVTAVEY